MRRFAAERGSVRARLSTATLLGSPSYHHAGPSRKRERFRGLERRWNAEHGSSLARRQPCRSDVARAVESRAFWRVPWSSRRSGWGSNSGSSARGALVRDRFGSGAAAINDEEPAGRLERGSCATAIPRRWPSSSSACLPKSDAPRQALDEQEAREWIETLSCLRSRFPQVCGPGSCDRGHRRLSDLRSDSPSSRHRRSGSTALKPLHDLLTASSGRRRTDCRGTRPWSRSAGCGSGFRAGRSRRSKSRRWANGRRRFTCPSSAASAAATTQTRMAAVACLGTLPIDSAAAAAVAYVDDPSARRPETNALLVLAAELALDR